MIKTQIKFLDTKFLDQCIELAHSRNSVPETNCAYCCIDRQSIAADLEGMFADEHSIMLGAFDDEDLVGIMGFFVHSPCGDGGVADCCGPFFAGNWNADLARDLFDNARRALSGVARINFYFNAKNADYHALMADLSAVHYDNEYTLTLRKDDFVQQDFAPFVVPFDPAHKPAFVALLDKTFPDSYVGGEELIANIGKTRKIFCALDDDGGLVGYGVLKIDQGNAWAEIFAVDEKHRGKGYGGALLNRVIAAAFDNHDVWSIDLVVDKMNTRAADLYYSFGFKMAVENSAYRL